LTSQISVINNQW